MSVSFSNLYQHSKGHVLYSPNGIFLAMVVGTRLVIRNPETFEVLS